MSPTQVDGYSSQRLAHVAAFGPVNLTLEDPQKPTEFRGPSSRWRKNLSCGALKKREVFGGGVMRHFFGMILL